MDAYDDEDVGVIIVEPEDAEVLATVVTADVEKGKEWEEEEEKEKEEETASSSPEIMKIPRINGNYVDVLKHIRVMGLDRFKKHYVVSSRKVELGYVLDVLPGTPHHPLTDMCKDLIVSEDLSHVVARGFDRIPKADTRSMEAFNMQPQFDLYEKVDGVLVRIFHFDGRWHVALGNSDTAKHVLPVGAMKNDNRTYQDLIFDVLMVDRCCYKRFNKICYELLDKSMTYLLQLVSPDLQNVTSYAIATMPLLAVRHTRTGKWAAPTRDAKVLFCQLKPMHSDMWMGRNIKTLMEGLTPKNPGFVVYLGEQPLFIAENKRFTDLYEMRHNRSSNLDKKIRLFLEGRHEDYVTQFPQESRVFDVMKGLMDKLMERLETFKKEIAATSLHEFVTKNGPQDYIPILESG